MNENDLSTAPHETAETISSIACLLHDLNLTDDQFFTVLPLLAESFPSTIANDIYTELCNLSRND